MKIESVVIERVNNGPYNWQAIVRVKCAFHRSMDEVYVTNMKLDLASACWWHHWPDLVELQSSNDIAIAIRDEWRRFLYDEATKIIP